MLPTLPARTLHARPPVARFAQAFSLLVWLFCVGMLGFAVAFIGPNLWTDWQVRDTAAQVRGGSLLKGSCRSKLFIHICDATLTAPSPSGGARLRREVSFAFASLDLGSFEAMVVADPRQPGLLTTDLALDHFWDRVATLVVGVGLLGTAFLFGLVQHLRARRGRALWRTSESVPVPLQLRSVSRSRSGVTWTVQEEGGTGAQWVLPHRSKPLTLPGEGRILGLRRQADGAVMPLDAGLRWVELSAAERAAALASAAMPGMNQGAAAA